MTSHIEDAVDLFDERYACGEAILMAYGPDYGLDRDLAQRLALPLAGGMGHLAKTCGAVTGAMLVLGLNTRATTPDEMELRVQTLGAVQQLVAEFTKLHGTLDCSALLGVDISTSEGYAEFAGSDLINTHCASFVKEVTEIIERIMAESASSKA
ncbi:MAG: C-GCAxxG-C-C family protein [bacterium]